MHRKPFLAAILALALGAVLGAGRVEAHLRPSTDLLLPYFEIDLAAGGMTTLVGLTNSSDFPVSAVATLYTNWGIPVLDVPLAFAPRQVVRADLRDWIVAGKLPAGNVLTTAQLAALQAELTGKRSPKDNLYYSTAVAAARAAGYVIVRVAGAPGAARAAALWGDSFAMDGGQDVAWGGSLVDVSSSVGCPDLCPRHGLRFLSGAGFDGGTQVVIWTARQGQPSAHADYPASALVQGTAGLYDEAGKSAGEHAMGLLPVQRVAIADLGAAAPFGWLDLELETGSFVGVRYDARGHYSIALETDCLETRVQVPGLALRKITNGSHDDAPPGATLAVGSPVAWRYVVRNTGQVPLSGVAVSDDQGVKVQCPKTTLDPLEEMICSGAGTAVACQYHNVGTAVANPPSGPELVAQDDGYYFGDAGAAVTLALATNGQRTAAPGAAMTAGSKVTWTYLVTNAGRSTLSSVAVQDDHGAVVSCPRTTLAPGAAMTCTATGTAIAGAYHNVGTVTGAGPCGTVQAHDDGYYHGNSAPPPPGISIKKYTNGQYVEGAPGPAIPVGSSVTWTYQVTNTGGVALSNVRVTDNRGVAVSCPRSALQPLESMTCTGYGKAVACQYSNTGSVCGTSPTGAAVSSHDDSWYFGTGNPAIALKKYTNGQRVAAAPGPTLAVGSAVTWTYQVTNTGDVPLINVQVADDQHVAVTCPHGNLQPGDSMTCTAHGTAIAGQYGNVGTATGLPPCGAAVTASDSSYYYGKTDNPPGISIKKSTNGQHVTCAPGPSIPVGSAVTWTYQVTNTGGVALSNVRVTDNRGVAVTCPKSSLQSGESMTCSGSGTAVACQYSNTGSVCGTAPSGASVTDHDSSWYFGTSYPAIAIKKYTNGQRVTAAPGPTLTVGSAVTWTYQVTNTGDVPLTSVQVADDQHVAVTCPQSSLQPGDSMTCTAHGTAVSGQYRNVGTATGHPACGAAVTASDSSYYYGKTDQPPGILIKKSTNGQYVTAAPGPSIPVGSLVTWTYLVTNTGGTALSNVRVTDNRGVTVTCPKSTLQPLESMTCTGYGKAVACQYNNTGSVCGTSPSGAAVSSHDDSWYFGTTNPAIAIKKYTNGQRVTAAPGPTLTVGSAVTWTYEVTNTGDSPLTSVQVADDQHVAVSCPRSALQPGESMTCSAHGTAISGQYRNVGTATGQPACGAAVTASDSSYYYGQGGGSSSCQGCSPGYWKNHTYSWPGGYSPGQTVASVWSQASRYPSRGSSTLLQGLSFQGGSDLDGAAQTLLRAAIAAMLNASDAHIQYSRPPSQVVSEVNDALASGDRSTMLSLASRLDADNNSSCPHH